MLGWHFRSCGLECPRAVAEMATTLSGEQVDQGRIWVFHFRLRVAMLVAALTALAGAGNALAVSPNLVISQVYGGGGNSGATYTHDYIEIFNRGSSTVALAGMSLQYASATGT